MTRKTFSFQIATTCVIVIAAPGRFSVGIMLSLEILFLMFFVTLFRFFIRFLRLKKLEKMEIDGTFENLTKKEIAAIQKEKAKLEKNLGGIKEMKELPGILFIIDTHKEQIAVAEACRMGIPIVAVVDTNCNPEGIDYPIPGNDDAIRAITLFTQVIANAVIEADNETGLKIIENLQDEDEDLTDTASTRTDDEEIIDYSNYTPTEPKDEDRDSEDEGDSSLVDEDKLYE